MVFRSLATYSSAPTSGFDKKGCPARAALFRFRSQKGHVAKALQRYPQLFTSLKLSFCSCIVLVARVVLSSAQQESRPMQATEALSFTVDLWSEDELRIEAMFAAAACPSIARIVFD